MTTRRLSTVKLIAVVGLTAFTGLRYWHELSGHVAVVRTWTMLLTNGSRPRPPSSEAMLASPLPASAAPEASIPCIEREPPVWPDKFVVVTRQLPDDDATVKGNRTVVLHYDFSVGVNLLQITPDDLDNSVPSHAVLWDLELDDHTSYYFYPSTKECRAVRFPVGILRPDWLEGATPVGETKSWDGSKTTCGYTKADFVDYHVDKETGDPDHWYLHNMKATFNVLYSAHGIPTRPDLFDPPSYCFDDVAMEASAENQAASDSSHAFGHSRLLQSQPHTHDEAVNMQILLDTLRQLGN